MNSNDGTDEPSRGNEGTSSNLDLTPCSTEISNKNICSHQDIMKRATAKNLIERYFYQLVDGCGNPNCKNKYCASSGVIKKLTPNEAAAEAIKLFQKDAKLCDIHPTKVARTDVDMPTSSTSSNELQMKTESDVEQTVSLTEENMIRKSSLKDKYIDSTPATSTSQISQCSSSEVSNRTLTSQSNGEPLTEEKVAELCEVCIETKISLPLIKALGEAFSQPIVLAKSFLHKTGEGAIEKACGDNKEREGTSKCNDPDKDVDSVTGPALNIIACRKAFQHLGAVPEEYYRPALITALLVLAESIEMDLRISKQLTLDDIINCFLIVFEMPDLANTDYLEKVVPALCKAAECLPLKGQAKLARMWATQCHGSLRHILETLQQLITICVISRTYTRTFFVQDDKSVTAATKLMKVVYYASMAAGAVESSSLREEPILIPNQLDPLGDALDNLYPERNIKDSKHFVPDDPLGLELGINVLDVRKPHLPFDEFYNEPLSDVIEMNHDYISFKIGRNNWFSFLKYPFILTPATKTQGLYYDNRTRMLAERRLSLVHAFFGADAPQPFLKLRVRRQHLIDDALVELEMIAMQRALDLKKQLVVEFIGEQGVDEGGVSKEFFQLVIEEIFNPDYGMFTTQPDSQTVWFNPTSFETDAQFTLIGIVLGLAIYNNVILAVNFPMVLYRKLMGKKGSFEDLAEWNPHLYNGLKSMLEYEGVDMEETFVQTFKICYQDVFGNTIFHDLKENADDVFVNQHNKEEFVDLYADFLLNKSVETQFNAFRRGFMMVTSESPLSSWFRPEEVDTLVCGSKNFDFNELEKSTEYDGGYTSESQIIKDFWCIVHSLSLDDKRKLLQFTTGSYRVPVGGLSHLKLVIARNGPDCDRLPTAHTCFNVLLLPEYESKEKLEDRLLKAISYSKGFGML